MDRNNRNDDSAHDSSTVRIFPTDQRTNIEYLNVQKQLQVDRTEESTIVALAVEESDSARQVEASERRSTMRCPEYDDKNIF